MKKISLNIILSLVLAITMSLVIAQDTAVLWTTDADNNIKTDFEPGEMVYVQGSGFNQNSIIEIKITRPDEVEEVCNAVECNPKFIDGLQSTDSEGNFLYRYDLDGIVGLYIVNVNDGANFVQTTFTDDAGIPNSINATYNSQTGVLNISGNYTDAPCSSTKRVGFAIFINGSNPVTPNGSKSLDGINNNTMHIINLTSCQTNGTWRDNHTIGAAPSSVCVVIYDVATNKINQSNGNNDIPAGSNRNDDNSYKNNGNSYSFMVINGKLDLDKDGSAGNSDDGTLFGVRIIDGKVDINNDSSVNNSDDSPPLFNGFKINDSLIDVNNDNVTNNNDDGQFANDPATCTSPNILGFCGNSIVDAGEQCDDGNNNNSDACKNNCTFNICGDGVIETGVEQCDDGNLVNGDGCDSNCIIEFCGDGITQPGLGEQCEFDIECDDANPFTVDTCNQCVCSNVDPVICGDGNVDPGEQCDDGNLNNSDSCKNNCTNNVCGDFVIFTGVEECDDGNNNNGDGCNSQCVIEFCGDGTLQQLLGEACDNGNFNTNVPCVPTYGTSCTFCNLSCQNITIQGPFCGDGIKNGPEQCDGNDLAGQTCQSLGHVNGTLKCDANCNFNFSDCRTLKEPIKDSKVSSAQKTKNFGTGRYMMINDKSNAVDRSYLGFDLSNGITSVSNAILEIFVYQTGSQLIGSIIEAWYCPNADFNELTINWNNQPANWNSQGVLLTGNCTKAENFTATNLVNSGLPQTKHIWNLTPEINDALSTDKKFTIVIKHDKENFANNNHFVQYLTKEYPDANFRPKLDLS